MSRNIQQLLIHFNLNERHFFHLEAREADSLLGDGENTCHLFKESRFEEQE
jgi:hypothetical protein